jgi:hypothetical protein
VLRLLRQAKRQIPRDVTAAGLLNAEFHATRNVSSDSLLQWTGTGSATNVRLSSNAGNAANSRKNEVAFGTIPLTLVAAASETDSRESRHGHPRAQEKEMESEPAEAHLRIGPVSLAMNATAPVDVGGWMSTAGYRFVLRGDVDLKDLFRLEDILGLPVTRPAAEGSAKLDVSVSGPWQGFAAAVTAGTAQLRNVRAEMRGLNTPIEIGAATMSLTPDAVTVEKISARTGSTHWSGEVRAPRHCTAPGAAANVASSCVFQFDLSADEISAGDLAEWFTPHPAKRPWYRILNSNPNSNNPLGSSALLVLQAHGNLHVGRFALKKVFATQLGTRVDLDRGKITLTALRAQLLQGTHLGNWTIEASAPDAQPMHYKGSGVLQNISLEQVGALMNDAWIAGTADGNFDLEGSGDSFHELLTHSDGSLQFVMRNGSLAHIEIPESPMPLPVHRFAGELRLTKGAWELSGGSLESHDGIYQVSGTASRLSGIDFVLTRGDEQSWTVTGTLAKPRVVPASRTEAKRTEAEPKTVKP